jgi:hypothetical protein
VNASVPLIGRVTFVVHFLTALVFGLGLLLVPNSLGPRVGFSNTPTPLELDAVLRAFGAMILGFGGLTSLYGILSKSWERVDYIVRGEITYCVLAVAVFFVSGVLGRGAALGNWTLTGVFLVLLGLFAWTWVARPKT